MNAVQLNSNGLQWLKRIEWTHSTDLHTNLGGAHGFWKSVVFMPRKATIHAGLARVG